MADVVAFGDATAAMAIWSNSLHVVPESVVMNRLIRAAADAAAHWATTSRMRVPLVPPVTRVVIVPVPSMAVLAVATFTVPMTGVPMKDGAVAMLSPYA